MPDAYWAFKDELLSPAWQVSFQCHDSLRRFQFHPPWTMTVWDYFDLLFKNWDYFDPNQSLRSLEIDVAIDLLSTTSLSEEEKTEWWLTRRTSWKIVSISMESAVDQIQAPTSYYSNATDTKQDSDCEDTGFVRYSRQAYQIKGLLCCLRLPWALAVLLITHRIKCGKLASSVTQKLAGLSEILF